MSSNVDVEKFSLSKEHLDNNYIHLTNFTVNKKGDTPNDYPKGSEVTKYVPMKMKSTLICKIYR